MKAVVLEIKGKYAAVLSDDGCVKKVLNQNYCEGEVIYMNTVTFSTVSMVKKIAIAACFVFVLGIGGFGCYTYYTPTTYVSLDVNPSIEYSLNMYDKVLSATAVNEDGAEVLENLDEDLTDKSINEAIEVTVEEISDQGYFDNTEDAAIVISTSNEDEEKADTIATDLEETADNTCEKLGKDVAIEAGAVGVQRVEEAKALGITPGKLNLIQKLRDSSENPEEFDINAWTDKSVKEIMKQTKENKKANKIEDKSEQAEEDTDTTADTDTPNEQVKPQTKSQGKAQNKVQDSDDNDDHDTSSKKEDKTPVLEEKKPVNKAKAEKKAPDAVVTDKDKKENKNESLKDKESKIVEEDSASNDEEKTSSSQENRGKENNNNNSVEKTTPNGNSKADSNRGATKK